MASAADLAVLNSIFNPLLPVGECVHDQDIPADLRDVEDNSLASKEAKVLELTGVRAAEAGHFESALTSFDKVIDLSPKRASGYNNRAQALRLMGRVDEAVCDLNTALELSEGRGRAACQAYTQRGMIHRLQKREELARQDFSAAAQLGSEFAKAQLVQMNPYAALCNKMLQDVFSKLQQGECT